MRSQSLQERLAGCDWPTSKRRARRSAHVPTISIDIALTYMDRRLERQGTQLVLEKALLA